MLTQSTAIRTALAATAMALTCAVSGCAGTDAKKKGLTAEQVYDQAQKDLRSSDFANAVRLYEQLESRYPFSNASRQGQLDLMYAYYRNDEPESAEDQADQFIRENP